MTWQEKVKDLMNKNDLNRKQLSKLSGITEASVSRYLKGKRAARMDIIINFTKALNVTVKYLLNDDSESNLSPSIAYNDRPDISKGRLRFSVFHELKHF